MVVDFYHFSACPSCRSVGAALKHLNVAANVKEVNLKEGEHLKPEFTKINPLHTVPTLVDDGFAIWESRAILCYLANKYTPGSSIYPADPKVRGNVDRWLYFDATSFFSALSAYYHPIVKEGMKPDPKRTDIIMDKLAVIDRALENSAFLAGDSLTIADISVACTSMTTAEACGFEINKFTNIIAWYERVKQNLSCWNEVVKPSQDKFQALFIGALNSLPK